MTENKYDPAIAARIKKSTYDYIVNVAKRRSETISEVVATAIYQYEEKCRIVDKRNEAKVNVQFSHHPFRK